MKALTSPLDIDTSAYSLVDAIEDSESAEVDVPVATESALADEGNENQASSACESDNPSSQGEEAANTPASIEQAEPGADVAQNDIANGVEKQEDLDDDIYDDSPKSAINGSPAKSIEGKEVEMSSGSESIPMVESSESDYSSKSQEPGVSVQQRNLSSESSDQSMDEGSSADMEIDEPLRELSAGAGDGPVQESSSSESSSSLSEDSSDSSEDDSDDDDNLHPEGGDDINDEEMPDVSDTSSSGTSSSEESESEEEEYEPPAAASPPTQVAAVACVATSASNSLAPETISRPAASTPAASTPRIIEDPPAPVAIEPAQRRPATVTSAEVAIITDLD